jgi:hypothetical protein
MGRGISARGWGAFALMGRQDLPSLHVHRTLINCIQRRIQAFSPYAIPPDRCIFITLIHPPYSSPPWGTSTRTILRSLGRRSNRTLRPPALQLRGPHRRLRTRASVTQQRLGRAMQHQPLLLQRVRRKPSRQRKEASTRRHRRRRRGPGKPPRRMQGPQSSRRAQREGKGQSRPPSAQLQLLRLQGRWRASLLPSVLGLCAMRQCSRETTAPVWECRARNSRTQRPECRFRTTWACRPRSLGRARALQGALPPLPLRLSLQP